MTDKKKYYKLDDIGFVGSQNKLSAKERKHIEKKTGDIFRAARAQTIDEYNEDLEERVTIEQYNKELDETMERINRGEFTTLEELKKDMQTW